MDDPASGDPKTRRRFSAPIIVVGLVFVVACVASFMLVAIGFGHRG